MKNLLLRAVPIALFISLAAAASGQQAIPPTPPTQATELTAEQWREDLRFMAAEMERRHVNLFHTVSRERFAAALADLDARIPMLQRNQIIVGMMRIAAMVGDGHTRIDPRKDARFGFPSLPLKLYLFEDGVYIRAAAPEHAALVGARIEAIGGVPIDEAVRRVSELASRDNEIGPRLFVPLYLNMPDILHALDMAPRRDAATLRLRKGGRTWNVTVPADAVDASWPPDTDISLITPENWVDARATPQPPLWLQAPLDYHRLVDLPEQNALYAQLNMVTNIEGETLAEFGRRIRERAQATNPRTLILDFRLNLGGNHDLRHGFVRELIRAEDADTRLFVLTGRGSFSATEFVLVDLDRLTDAIFIGEPASSKPSSYGDAYRMPMPNSGITIRSSIRWNATEQNRDPWTWVDIATPLTFAAYASGRDPALEAALAYTPVPPLHERLVAAGTGGGGDAVREALESYFANPANRYADQEGQLLLGSQSLLWAGQMQAAVMVAEQTTERFPGSADAFNVLAHVAEEVGRLGQARQAGLRVLELEPNNRPVRSLLERLPAHTN